MSFAIRIACALAFFAGAAHADEDRSAYVRAQARLTEELNAVIAEGIELRTAPPPAKADDSGDELPAASGSRRASR